MMVRLCIVRLILVILKKCWTDLGKAKYCQINPGKTNHDKTKKLLDYHGMTKNCQINIGKTKKCQTNPDKTKIDQSTGIFIFIG